MCLQYKIVFSSVTTVGVNYIHISISYIYMQYYYVQYPSYHTHIVNIFESLSYHIGHIYSRFVYSMYFQTFFFSYKTTKNIVCFFFLLSILYYGMLKTPSPLVPYTYIYKLSKRMNVYNCNLILILFEYTPFISHCII